MNTAAMPERQIPKLVTDIADVRKIVEVIRERGVFVFDYETLGTKPLMGRVAGLGFAWGTQPEEAAYVLTEHLEHPTVPWEDVWAEVKPLMEDPSIKQIAHNWLYDAHWNAAMGAQTHNNYVDTMVLNWLLDTERLVGLKPSVEDFFGYKMQELTDFTPSSTVNWHPGKILRLDMAPLDKMLDYATDDVTWTYRLYEYLWPKIEAEPTLLKLWNELYVEALQVINDMQVTGIMFDKDLVAVMEEGAQVELDTLIPSIIQKRPGQDFDPEEVGFTGNIDKDRKLIPQLADKWKDRTTLRPMLYENPHLAHKVFNPGSTQQLGKVVYEEIGLTPLGKRGKSGEYSLKAEVLLRLAPKDPTGLIKDLLNFRKLEKLHSQYLVGLTPHIDHDGRLRTSFRATLKTGRLSSSSPNLQNIIHNDKYPVRKAFVARPGYKLLVADYSQIELRVLAHLAQEPLMIEGFLRGDDPHSITAISVFDLDVPANEVARTYPHARQASKMVNFATVYGVGDENLANQISDATDGKLAPTAEEAGGYKEALFQRMPGVRVFVRRQETLAERYGVVHTVLGRPRHLPDAQQRQNRAAYFGALRRGVNSPIQGSAGDIIMLAMRNIRRYYRELGLWGTAVSLCLQVHDELVFEIRDDLLETAIQVIPDLMRNAVQLDVPLDVEASIATNWYEGK